MEENLESKKQHLQTNRKKANKKLSNFSHNFVLSVDFLILFLLNDFIEFRLLRMKSKI